MKILNQFIHRTDALGQIRLTAKQLETLVGRIRASLPSDIAAHVTGCAPRPAAVVVFVDSAAWATQLRYMEREILAVCRQALDAQIQRVQFKVLPAESFTGKPPAPQLSENSRSILERTANGIADDELAAALRRLSENAGQDAE